MSLDPQQLRGALGAYATGVTVVTTLSEAGPLGMTVNSFASVSLDPPLVLWSPARRSGRFPAFEAAAYFAIHVLAADQQPWAERFAGDGLDFEGLDWAEGDGGTPLLPDCAARFECVHSAGHDGGDHLIVVGEVLRFAALDKPPLVFHGGRYKGVSG